MKFQAGVALAGGIVSPILATGTGMSDMTQAVILWGGAGVIATFMGHRALMALNKLADLPSRSEWESHVGRMDGLRATVISLDKKIDIHIESCSGKMEASFHRADENRRRIELLEKEQ